MKKQNENRIAIIDGTSLMVDAYHESLTEEVINASSEEEREKAFKTLEVNEKGEYIGAIRGFFETMFDIVDKVKPTHIAVAWGTSRATNIRKEIYPKYKCDSNSMDMPLREQFNTVRKMLLNMVEQYTSKQYEAIDIAGTICESVANKGKISVFARNTNYLQLANIADVYLKTSKAESLINKHNLSPLKIPNGFFKYDSLMVFEEKGLTSEQILDFGAVVGSTTVGIPGVKGVGPTTILPLLKYYGNLDNIYKTIDNNSVTTLATHWKAELGIRNPINKLIVGKDDAYLSKKLLTINNCIFNTPINLNDIENTISAKEVAKELLFVGILSKNVFENYESLDSCDSNFNLKSLIGHKNDSAENSTIQYSINSVSTNGHIGEESFEDSVIRDLFSENSQSLSKHYLRDEDYYDEISDDHEEYDEPYEDEDDDYEYYTGEDIAIISVNSSPKIESNSILTEQEPCIMNSNGFEIISEKFIRTYRCSCTPEPFIIEASRPINCCPFCGAGKKHNNSVVPNIEDTGVRFKNMRTNANELLNTINKN